ncbi:hypothetical protein [Pseudorhodoplanes sinuspersici]|uniref:Uncharacterized protein n=1 Tax=Pseudorhodoplanes sinuspersici TaxID=1235591 RepID=A0A1W6ZXT6_9HYPH|nr:hypothetical protein [Pseudorhodoplanes sinuspersici]ARQ02088.1 hypothetical protein CAK95_25555 [Pseudorhodoplanes sinuspersici]RKE73886.1 hypothetical protein DFP91_1783 [Pseudorhodoplanes sinuspersici]
MILSPFLRRHVPGIAAAVALAIGAVLWLWVTQETSVTLNVFFGGRQIAIVICAGIFLGGLAAEFFALVAWSSPGETPVGSAIIGLIIALPFYALIVLLGMAAQD